MPIKRIVKRSGCSRQTVRRILQGEREDMFRVRASSLEPWLPRLDREWTGDCRNGAELWRRLREAGFGSSLRVVTEWATRSRRAESVPDAQPRMCPSARRLAAIPTRGRDHLSRQDAVMVALVEAATRLIGAVLLEQNDEWQLQHRYTQIEGMAELASPLVEDTTPLITPHAA